MLTDNRCLPLVEHSGSWFFDSNLGRREIHQFLRMLNGQKRVNENGMAFAMNQRDRIGFAITMIFLGPLQFWTGFRMRYLTLHKWCGPVFLVTGAYVACTAMYMGLHPRLGGIVYGFGLFLNGMF